METFILQISTHTIFIQNYLNIGCIYTYYFKISQFYYNTNIYGTILSLNNFIYLINNYNIHVHNDPLFRCLWWYLHIQKARVRASACCRSA